MEAPVTLSVCMIVRDEAHQIAKALHSVAPVADEIIVVDTGSKDRTVEIARRYTPYVYCFEWNDDFSAARNFSLSKATKDCILWLDADDRLDNENLLRLGKLKTIVGVNQACYFRLQDVRNGKKGHVFYQLRWVPNRSEVRFSGRVHETLEPSICKLGIPCRSVDVIIYHHGYKQPSVLRRKLERNIRLIEREIQSGRDDLQILYYMAQSFSYLGDVDKAIQTMQRVLERLRILHFKDDHGLQEELIVDIHLFIAEHLVLAGEKDKALRHLAVARAMSLSDRYPLFRTACIYQGLEDHKAALRCLSKALKVEQKILRLPRFPVTEPNIWAQMGYSFYCLGEYRRAKECFNKAFELGGIPSEIWQSIAFFAMKNHRFEMARYFYERCAELGSMDSDDYTNMGLLWSRAGFLEKARMFYRKALAIEPDHIDCLVNFASLELRSGNLGRACELYKRLLKLGVRDLDVLIAACVVFLKVLDRDGWSLILSTVEDLFPAAPLGSLPDNGDQLLMYLKEEACVREGPKLARWADILIKGYLKAKEI